MCAIAQVGHSKPLTRDLSTKYCTEAEIVDQRGGGDGKKPRYACSHRNRPISESLTEFRAMRDGKYKPNEAEGARAEDHVACLRCGVGVYLLAQFFRLSMSLA